MKLTDPDLLDRLAADYALGLMRGKARRRFERMWRADPALRQKVRRWQGHFTHLLQDVPEASPPPRIWEAIAARQQPAAKPSLWHRLPLWQGAAAAFFLSSLTLAALLYRDPGRPDLVAVLVNQQAGPVITLQASGDKIVAEVGVAAVADPRRSLELWMLPGNAQPPVSLGVLPTAGRAEIALTPQQSRLLQTRPPLAVSVEPPGGSPTGLPTGPILYQGRILSFG